MRKINKIAIVFLAALSSCRPSYQVHKAGDHTVPATFKSHSGATSDRMADHFFNDRYLVGLIDTALAQNADLLIATERIEIARANVLHNKGALYPTVNANVSAGANQYGLYTMDGTGNATTPGLPAPIIPDYAIGLSSSWEADIWGKLRNRKRAASLRYLSTEAGRDFVATNVIAEVARHYYALISFDEELAIIRKNIKLQERALEIVQLQKEVGRATELAVRQFTAQLAQTQALQHEVQINISVTENELNFLLGRYAQPIPRSGSVTTEALGMAGIGVPSQLLTRRPDIVQAERELNATSADATAARAAYLPSFNISAAAGYNAFNTGMLFNPSSFAFGVLGGLSAPVLNRSQIKANFGVMVAEHNTAYLQYGKTVMNAVYEVCNSLENIDQLQRAYTLNEKAAANLNEAVSISNDIYLAGYANYLEVITAQKNALDADLTVVQVRKRILLEKIGLYRALGGK